MFWICWWISAALNLQIFMNLIWKITKVYFSWCFILSWCQFNFWRCCGIGSVLSSITLHISISLICGDWSRGQMRKFKLLWNELFWWLIFRTKKKLAAKEKQPEETQGIEPLVYQHDTLTGKLKSKKIRKLWRKAMRYALNPDDDIKSIGEFTFFLFVLPEVWFILYDI